MDNQHRKIKGYRELSQDEIDLMNEIKSKGEELEALINKAADVDNAKAFGDEIAPKVFGEAARWREIAKTNFQTGLMALTRSVAKPEFF